MDEEMYLPWPPRQHYRRRLVDDVHLNTSHLFTRAGWRYKNNMNRQCGEGTPVRSSRHVIPSRETCFWACPAPPLTTTTWRTVWHYNGPFSRLASIRLPSPPIPLPVTMDPAMTSCTKHTAERTASGLVGRWLEPLVSSRGHF